MLKHLSQSMVAEPCELALVGVPLMALKMPIESERVLLVPSSTGFICGKREIKRQMRKCVFPLKKHHTKMHAQLKFRDYRKVILGWGGYLSFEITE